MRRVLRNLWLVAGLFGLTLLVWGIWPPPRATVEIAFADVEVHAAIPRSLRAGDTATASLDIRRASKTPPQAAPVQLETTLGFNGVAVEPAGSITITLASTRPATLTWRLQSATPGAYVGSLWFHQILPDGSRLARATKSLHIRVHTLLGLTGREARVLGLITLLVAALLKAVSRWQTISITDATKAR